MHFKIVLIVIGIAAISGCVTNDNEATDGTLIVNGTCPQGLPPQLECSADDNLIHISGQTGDGRLEAIELKVSLFDQSLLVENVHLSEVRKGLAVAAIACDCQITLRNVTLSGTSAGNTGLVFGVLPQAEMEVSIAMENVILTGFDVAIQSANAHSISLRGVNIECGRRGLTATDTHTIETSDLVVNGCEESGLELTNTNSLELTDDVFHNNAVGVNLRGATHQVAVAGQGTLFEENGIALRADSATLSVSRFQVINNGVPKEYLATAGLGDPGGIHLVLGGGSVHDSVFTGNAGIALQSAVGNIEATDNWWGSAQGPRIQTAAGPIPPVGDGDVVTTTVDFVPFRQQPPR